MSKKTKMKRAGKKQNKVVRNEFNLSWESIDELKSSLISPTGALLLQTKELLERIEPSKDDVKKEQVKNTVKMITSDISNYVNTVIELTKDGAGKTGPITKHKDLEYFISVGLKAEELGAELEQLLAGSFATLTSLVSDIEGGLKEVSND